MGAAYGRSRSTQPIEPAGAASRATVVRKLTADCPARHICPTPAREAASAEPLVSPTGLLDGLQLGESDVVPGRVTECSVDPVRPWFWLLHELDSTPGQLFVGGLAIVGGQENRAGKALGHEVPHLVG